MYRGSTTGDVWPLYLAAGRKGTLFEFINLDRPQKHSLSEKSKE